MVTERFNIAREVNAALTGTAERALLVLPALAGEILAGDDQVSISELKDALSMYQLQQLPNHQIAEAVLAMVRSYTIHQAAHFNY